MHGRVSSYLRRQHLALVVVFFALCGGSAYALDGTDTVFSDDIVNGEVRTGDVFDDGVRSIDVRDDTLAAGGLTAPDLAPGSVGASEVYDASVRTEDVRGGLAAADLQSLSVGAGELADQGWTGAEIDEGSLGTVPVATLAGKGRSAFHHPVCEAPEDTNYLTCVSVPLTTSRTTRLLATATGVFYGWDTAHCRFRIDPYVSGGGLVGPYVTEAPQIQNYNFLVVHTLGGIPAGSMVVQFQCISDYVFRAQYSDLQLSVVAIRD